MEKRAKQRLFLFTAQCGINIAYLNSSNSYSVKRLAFKGNKIKSEKFRLLLGNNNRRIKKRGLPGGAVDREFTCAGDTGLVSCGLEDSTCLCSN